MASDSATIEKLILDVGGKKIELTMEQARKLFGALDEMFGKKTEHVHHYGPYYSHPWRWQYTTPSWATCGVSSTFDSGSKTLCCSVS